MPGKLDTYNLGDFGVNRTKSPVHIKDGELLSAQNASLNPVGGNRGITKRKGMAKYSYASAGGVILAIEPIYYADPFPAVPPTLAGFTAMYNIEAGFGGTDAIATSPTGVTWTEAGLTRVPLNNTGFPLAKSFLYNDGSADYMLYLSTNAGGDLVLQGWDGSAEVQIGSVLLAGFTSANISITSYWKSSASDYLWMVWSDSVSGLQTIKRYQLSTDTLLDWGETFGGAGDYPAEYINDLVEFDGDLIAACTEDTGATTFITRFRKVSATVDGTMSVEYSLTNADPTNNASWTMVAGDSYLIAGGQGTNTLQYARLLRRDTSGTWTVSVVETVGDFCLYIPVYCVGDEFFYWRNSLADGTLTLERSTDAGANWTTQITRSDGTVYLSLLWKLGSDYYFANCQDLGSDITVQKLIIGSGESTIFTRAWGGFAHGMPYMTVV